MTVIETVKNSIVKYPGPYACENFEDSKLNVLEQFFIVLGNGIEWAYTKDPKKAGYLTEPMHYRKNDEWTRKFDLPYGKRVCPVANIDRYFNEKMFTVYDKDYRTNHKTYYVFESDLGPYMDDAYMKLENDRNKRDSPYPNFQKQYSCFWEPGVEYIQEDWRLAGIQHLSYWQEYFKDPERVKTYSHYHIGEKQVKSLQEYIEKYFQKEGKTIKQIAKEYEFPEFDGTNYQLMSAKRWEKELSSNLEFIEETIAKLSK